MFTLDRLGEELQLGDIVAYADTNVSGSSISLDVYQVIEMIDEFTCKGRLLNGPWAGEEFYLVDTTSRCAYLYHDDEDDEEYLQYVQSQLN